MMAAIECIMCGSDDTEELEGDPNWGEPDILECYSCGYSEPL